MATDPARVEGVRRMLQTLTRQIAERCPPRLANWAPAWQRVEGPSRLLLDMAAAYERHEANREDVLAAARDAREAWHDAARLFFERRFCPRCGDRLDAAEADGNWCEDCFREIAGQARESEEARP